MKSIGRVKNGEPRRHHYVPQFYLRNFAIDEDKKKITLVRKLGHRAVWQESSIKSIAYETDFYVHQENGAPVSVETKINENIESPLSASDTWRKIVEGRVSDLDSTDRPILYALVRHLEVRTPHYFQTAKELCVLSEMPDSGMAFSAEEQGLYYSFNSNPSLLKATLNSRATDGSWAENDFRSCSISILRTAGPVFACTTPVHSIKLPSTTLLRSVQMGLDPVGYLLPLTPNCYVLLVLGDFDGYFANKQIGSDLEFVFKRHIVGQFSYWPIIEHMICPSEDLVEHLNWAGFDLIQDTPNKISFMRRQGMSVHKTP
ncbi:MAG: DUF4238 domain-containing protein [Rhizobiaceae bacterium]